VGSRTRWARPEAQAGDLERIAIHEVLAFGKADGRCQTGMSRRQVHGGYARSRLSRQSCLPAISALIVNELSEVPADTGRHR